MPSKSTSIHWGAGPPAPHQFCRSPSPALSGGSTTQYAETLTGLFRETFTSGRGVGEGSMVAVGEGTWAPGVAVTGAQPLRTSAYIRTVLRMQFSGFIACSLPSHARPGWRRWGNKTGLFGWGWGSIRWKV